jgi:chaperonin GroES
MEFEQETAMRFRPLHDHVLVTRLDEQERSTGGIIIPDTAKEKPMEVCVVAVGPGALSRDGKVLPMSVNVGDRIVTGKWSGTDVKIDGEEFLILKEEDVLGVIDETTISTQAA